MSVLEPKKRMLLLVDTQNLFYSLRDLYGQDSRLDFLKLREIACRRAKCDFIHAIIYLTVYREDLAELSNFLISNGFDVRVRELETASKGDMDSHIIVETMTIYKDYDVVVLCSGDSDFIPLVEKLRAENKEVGLLAVSSTTAKRLDEACNWSVYLDKRILMSPSTKKEDVPSAL